MLQFYDPPRTPRRPASDGSWSPSPTTPTSARGGRPATAWATSTAFTHQVVDLVTAIGRGRAAAPSFADGLQVQRVLAAVEQQRSSCRSSRQSPWRPERRSDLRIGAATSRSPI